MQHFKQKYTDYKDKKKAHTSDNSNLKQNEGKKSIRKKKKQKK